MSLSKTFAAHINTSADGTVLTSPAFDSTGYTHVLVAYRYQASAVTMTPSDNKGSTVWAAYTEQANTATPDEARNRFYLAKIGTPGTGHTVTMTGSASRAWRGMHVWLINATTGEIALETQSTATANNATPDAGSLVTTQPTVSFMSVAPYTGGITYTQGSGWTEDFDTDGGENDYSYAQSRADSSGTLDPVCTVDGSTAHEWVAVAVSFREVATSIQTAIIGNFLF